MSDRRPISFSLLRSATVGYVYLDTALVRLQSRLRRSVAGLLSEALSVDEQRDLLIGMYDRDRRKWVDQCTELHAWELPWFDRRLPPAPSRVLVAGAGAGREAAALVAAGYAVDCLEPAPYLAQRCGEVIGAAGDVVAATHEQFAHAVLERSGTALCPIADRTYDAVLLGWGSFSHVLLPADRARVLEAYGRCCPAGPLLASFTLAPYGSESATPRGFADLMGRSVGRGLRRLRRPGPGQPHEFFSSWMGFTHRFSRDELEGLAVSAGRVLAWDAQLGEYPHATFLPGRQEKPTDGPDAGG